MDRQYSAVFWNEDGSVQRVAGFTFDAEQHESWMPGMLPLDCVIDAEILGPQGKPVELFAEAKLFIDGWLESCRVDENLILLMDEDGHAKQLKPNRGGAARATFAYRGQPVLGRVVEITNGLGRAHQMERRVGEPAIVFSATPN